MVLELTDKFKRDLLLDSVYAFRYISNSNIINPVEFAEYKNIKASIYNEKFELFEKEKVASFSSINAQRENIIILNNDLEKRTRSEILSFEILSLLLSYINGIEISETVNVKTEILHVTFFDNKRIVLKNTDDLICYEVAQELLVPSKTMVRIHMRNATPFLISDYYGVSTAFAKDRLNLDKGISRTLTPDKEAKEKTLRH